ncbi:hypothetical protein [Pedobacter rhizosphaerae]|uniref:DUF1440 domain-containing protein n=1 Tax=Pedobacter rhizosphaerae TaxID=390241 RepID=A0A1H9WAP4_9SPHI|nr:hypothetical protein [Pedobacter rhizosphaerae]SES30859.1 hypothetical protein SAMN04488023_1667 [Pedobacter rhizosphaerae]
MKAKDQNQVKGIHSGQGIGKVGRILISAICGTSMMTVSSKLMSLIGQNFSEPHHLGKMISRLDPVFSKNTDKALGWTAHLGMGAAFCSVYSSLFDSGVKPNLKNSILLGLISGAVGMGIWKATFKLHPFPTSINPGRFYLQRMPAHIVFAVFATLSYRLLVQQKEEKIQSSPQCRLTE